MKIVRLGLLACSVVATVALTAAPAAAATPMLAAKPWFYWVAPILVLSGAGMIGLLALGYYLRVLRPKYRGR